MEPVWRSVHDAAGSVARDSGLQGYYNGPADAARHIIGTAELRRRAGIAAAWTIVNGNEEIGRWKGHAPEVTAMDNANNAIGLAIGARARTFPEIVAMAREAMQQGIERGGTGAEGTPTWLPPSRWRMPDGNADPRREEPVAWTNPDIGGDPYSHGGPESGFGRGLNRLELEALRLRDLSNVPPEAWSEDDARAVIRSRPYSTARDPDHQVWQERVRAYFRAKTERDAQDEASPSASDEQRSDRGSGGMVDVSAYSRRGEHGSMPVAAHQRSAPR